MIETESGKRTSAALRPCRRKKEDRMSTSSTTRGHSSRTVFAVAAACAVAGVAAGVLAAEAEQLVVVPFEQAKFVAVDPARPDGPRLAVLWGDPATGPSAVLLKLKRSTGRLHVHSSDYHLAVLEGTVRHWAAGEKEEAARPLGRGSYWFQPGNQAHGDACLTDECVMFVHWTSRMDARLADEDEPKPAR
jgi:hypothetical protein